MIGMVIAIIRVRGRTGLKPDIVHTLLLLKLTRKNHCVLMRESVTLTGMLQRCKDYVTWGPINREVLTELVAKRGRLPGDKRVQQEMVEGIVDAVEGGQPPNIKSVFRLHPPRKGWKGMKHPWPHGALGSRGEEINDLLKKMM